MNTVGTPLLWGGFAVVVVIMLAIDLLLQGRRGAHTMSMKQAAARSIVWVTLSLLFNAAFWWYGGKPGPRRCRPTGTGVPDRLSDRKIAGSR